MVFLNQILFKYYENVEICYVLYYLDIHQKELKSIQPLFLNTGTQLLFMGRSSQKGFISTNLLAACLFCLQFCYILAGWEGSAADSWIFENACRTDFVIEAGTYYLADAEFSLCNVLLVPYCGVWYHLNEWEQANLW